jgi:hypothetical protein
VREIDRFDALVFDRECIDELATGYSCGIGGGSREMAACVWVELEEGLRVISAVGREVGGGGWNSLRVDETRVGPYMGEGSRSSLNIIWGEVVIAPSS